jgi:hypothetical protein
MDFSSIDEVGNARLSNSPASIPIFVEEPASPAKSVHLETMGDQITEQPGSGAGTADFFDDTSSDDENEGIARVNIGQAPTPVIGPSKHHPTSGYQRCSMRVSYSEHY